MEAHLLFTNAHLTCSSYGTGSQVKLPGKSAMEPKVFKFGVPYAKMYESLAAEDAGYFNGNGILPLCSRGASVKESATQWQSCRTCDITAHDVVLAFEERIYDAVVEDLQTRDPTDEFKPLLVVCLDTKDNPREAAKAAKTALDMCWRIDKCEDLLSEVGDIIEEFGAAKEKESDVRILYQICYL